MDSEFRVLEEGLISASTRDAVDIVEEDLEGCKVKGSPKPDKVK
jgi:hypothetical protein